MESLIHNMSAPPRSKIILAPNIQETTFLAFSLLDLPAKQMDFPQQFLQFCGLSSYAQLLERLVHVDRTLRLAPILTLGTPTNTSQDVPGLFTSIALLSRSTGSLYMKRRKPHFSYERLSKTIYIPQHHFLHLCTGGELCLP